MWLVEAQEVSLQRGGKRKNLLILRGRSRSDRLHLPGERPDLVGLGLIQFDPVGLAGKLPAGIASGRSACPASIHG